MTKDYEAPKVKRKTQKHYYVVRLSDCWEKDRMKFWQSRIVCNVTMSLLWWLLLKQILLSCINVPSLKLHQGEPVYLQGGPSWWKKTLYKRMNMTHSKNGTCAIKCVHDCTLWLAMNIISWNISMTSQLIITAANNCNKISAQICGLGGVDKKFCLWDIQASNLTSVAKLIQGHKYRDVYILYLCMPFGLSSFNFPHLGYLITRLSWCLLLRTITVTCNLDKHEEKEKESTSCGRWWPDVYGILRWSHGHSDSHVEKHSIMAGIISNVHNISSVIHLRSQLQCSEFC